MKPKKKPKSCAPLKIKSAVVKKAIDTEGDIELYQDTKFEKSVKCGNIISIGERRNINALDIDALDINAWDINALDIDAWDIDAWDINALDIDAWDIVCESRKKKSEKSKTTARIFITRKSTLERKEWK